eukprot:TRINITY_DN105743_c0_g1_i1.p1 TRINITY_DN105743_c0_g1~~TRINITY_DN105743_c0_g1_i1.p1  ORF type:complete len:508 (-),score=62.81 TRINITY_DN105743_c0_g1_i1:133-1656(-)
MSASKPSGSETPARRAKGGVLGLLDASADTASTPRLSQAGQDFFRTRLWSPAPMVRPPTQSFQDTVLATAAELVAPSSSAAPPRALTGAAEEVNEDASLSSPLPKVAQASAAQPSGVNAPERPARATEVSPGATPVRRSLRSQGEVLTPSPASPRVRSPGKLSPAKLISSGSVLARQKQSVEDRIGKFLSMAGVSSPPPSRPSVPSSPPASKKRKAGADTTLMRSPQTGRKSRSTRSRLSKSPSPLALPPSSRSKATKGANAKSGEHQTVVPKSPAKGTKIVPLDANILKCPNKGRHHELRALALTTVSIEQLGDRSAGRSKRCRMQPLETWRNERVVYKREPGSHMPAVVAVELNLSPRPAQDPPRSLGLIAVQPPPPLRVKGEPLRNLEFIGVQNKALSSRVFALPLRRSSTYTVSLEGVGILHMFEGSLRYTSQEGFKDEGMLHQGDTMLVHGKLVVGPAGTANASTEGNLGARFRWVQVHADRGKRDAHDSTVEQPAIADIPA